MADATKRPASPQLAELVAGPDASIDLARVALCIASDEYPNLDTGQYLQRLDALADAVRARLQDADPGTAPSQWRPGALLDALATQLFEVEGFTGNSTEYYDPRNSFLNDVLDRRVGIPISLSVVYIEVGQRLGLSIVPVSFPTHFLVQVRIGDTALVVDPFNQGYVLGRDALVARLLPLFGDRDHAEAYLPTALASVPRREVVARMLRNLKAIHMAEEDWTRALLRIEQLLIVNPGHGVEIRDRGHVFAALECPQAALSDFEHYLRLHPGADDAAGIRERLPRLRAQASRLN